MNKKHKMTDLEIEKISREYAIALLISKHSEEFLKIKNAEFHRIREAIDVYP